MRSKAQVQTIEALISVAIISFIIFLLYFITPMSQEISQINRKIEAYNALKILDKTRNLRQYALQANATKVEELLLPFLKSSFKVVIYNQTSNITEVPKVESENIASVSYLIAGELANYKPLEIRVYLWWKIMKGEAFLLASLIISVSLVAMFQPMRSEYLVKQKQLLESELILNIFENIFDEIKNSIYFSYDDFDSMILNLYDFLNFSQKISNKKTMDLRSLVLILRADESNQMNITVINFISDNLQLNLTFNDTQNSILTVPLYSINSTTFSFTSGETYTLSIQYEDVIRNIEIELPANKKTYLAYVDATLSLLEDRRRKIEYFFMS